MSEYFRVLKRIEKEQQAEQRLEAGSQRQVTHAVARPVRTAAAGTIPAAPTPNQIGAPYRALFDSIRVAGGAAAARSLVFAAASPVESVQAVTTGLAAHVRSLGLEVLIAEIADWNGRPILKRRTDKLREAPSAGDAMPVDLGAPGAQTEIAEWIEGATRVADLILIEGRPLSESIDAALLARKCDGLVIVAQTEVTHRDALRVAAERARAAGCNILGVVMYGTKHRLPEWLRRIVRAAGAPD